MNNEGLCKADFPPVPWFVSWTHRLARGTAFSPRHRVCRAYSALRTLLDSGGVPADQLYSNPGIAYVSPGLRTDYSRAAHSGTAEFQSVDLQVRPSSLVSMFDANNILFVVFQEPREMTRKC